MQTKKIVKNIQRVKNGVLSGNLRLNDALEQLRALSRDTNGLVTVTTTNPKLRTTIAVDHGVDERVVLELRRAAADLRTNNAADAKWNWEVVRYDRDRPDITLDGGGVKVFRTVRSELAIGALVVTRDGAYAASFDGVPPLSRLNEYLPDGYDMGSFKSAVLLEVLERILGDDVVCSSGTTPAFVVPWTDDRDKMYLVKLLASRNDFRVYFCDRPVVIERKHDGGVAVLTRVLDTESFSIPETGDWLAYSTDGNGDATIVTALTLKKLDTTAFSTAALARGISAYLTSAPGSLGLHKDDVEAALKWIVRASGGRITYAADNTLILDDVDDEVGEAVRRACEVLEWHTAVRTRELGTVENVVHPGHEVKFSLALRDDGVHLLLREDGGSVKAYPRDGGYSYLLVLHPGLRDLLEDSSDDDNDGVNE